MIGLMIHFCWLNGILKLKITMNHFDFLSCDFEKLIGG